MESREAKGLFARIKKTSNVRIIKEQGGRTRRVKLQYRKANGDVVKREVRPYEIKAHRTSGRKMLYVTDTKDGANQIKSYAVSGIVSAEKIPGKFKPVYPVQFERVKSAFRNMLISRRKRKRARRR